MLMHRTLADQRRDQHRGRPLAESSEVCTNTYLYANDNHLLSIDVIGQINP